MLEETADSRDNAIVNVVAAVERRIVILAGEFPEFWRHDDDLLFDPLDVHGRYTRDAERAGGAGGKIKLFWQIVQRTALQRWHMRRAPLSDRQNIRDEPACGRDLSSRPIFAAEMTRTHLYIQTYYSFSSSN